MTGPAASAGSRPRVYVTRRLPGGTLDRLARATDLRVCPRPGGPSADELAHGARDADALLCMLTDQIDAELIASASTLRVISSCSVGVDHVDLAAATRAGIPVGHTPGVLVETTADLAFALLLAAARRVAEADRFVRAGAWTPERRWSPDLLLGRDLHGATLGIIGLGRIGRAVARRARGFDMRVLAWSRTPRQVPGVEHVSLDALLAASDFVTVHVALVPETHGLLDAARIAQMKPGAVLVNTARGGLVDEPALASALRSGHLTAAALDVFEREPLDSESPLRSLENVVLAPHIGSASVATRTRMAELSVSNLLAGLEGARLPHCANPEVYEAVEGPPEGSR